MGKWHVDETYIKVKGRDTYLYRAIDKSGATVDFMYSKTRNLQDAKAFFKRAIKQHGLPVQVTLDGSQTNDTAARQSHCEARMRVSQAIDPLIVRRSKYMNNRIEQAHRRVKRRIRPMLGFKSDRTASTILEGIELIHMIRKGQMIGANAANPSLTEQFNLLAA